MRLMDYRMFSSGSNASSRNTVTNNATFWRILFASAAIVLAVMLFSVFSYRWTYWSLIVFLLCSSNVQCGITVQYLSYFLLGYLSIALLDVTHYRGVVALETLQLYSLTVLISLVGLVIIDLVSVLLKKHDNRRYIFLGPFNKIQRNIVICHLVIVYIALVYVYENLGIVVLNQELRFAIPTSVNYIIKSSIYIPLVYWSSRCLRTKTAYLLYIILPLLPATLIGSRGTVVMVLLGMFSVQALQKRSTLVSSQKTRLKSGKIFLASFVLIGLIYVPYYLRRLAPGTNYLSPKEALHEYFYSDSFVGYLLMPLHLGFKETIMLTNNIIVKQIENVHTNIPLFFADLLTILPGKQTGAGEAMGGLFGTVTAGGLTPGIVGGLYIDFRNGSIFIIFALVTVIYFIERFSRLSDKFLVIYVLSFIQFLHLFHRGFVKPEYLFAYVIVSFYLVFGNYYKGKVS